MSKVINTPLTDDIVLSLKSGDKILLSGEIYTARDTAHKRLCDLIAEKKQLPFSLKGQVIYFVGPSPARPCYVAGSSGPTTSERMDAYSPLLIENGLKGMIGKGNRDQNVIDYMKKHNAVYFVATGGAGALISKRIKSCELFCFEDLGEAEAIYKMVVEDLPVVVAIDCFGDNLFQMACHYG